MDQTIGNVANLCSLSIFVGKDLGEGGRRHTLVVVLCCNHFLFIFLLFKKKNPSPEGRQNWKSLPSIFIRVHTLYLPETI